MSFKRVKGADRGNRELNITTEALAVGEALVYVPGSDKVTAATSSAEIDLSAGIVVKAATNTDTQVLVQTIMEGDEYIVATSYDTSTDDNYNTMALTNSTTVNNSGTTVADDTGVVRQLGIVGATTDRLVRVEFVRVSHAD